jgi:AcrR family transcriptional regulator
MVKVDEGEPEAALPRKRRKRRSRDDVEGRLIAVARELFAERGYAAVTTREIARMADVSETLLFRYFNDKAQLFDSVVSKPFNELMLGFIAEQREASPGPEGAHHMFVAVYELFEQNRELMSAAYLGRKLAGDDGVPVLHGLGWFFEQSEQSQSRDNADRNSGIDLSLGVRLAFGMIASAVMMRDWLFSDQTFERDEIMATLETMTRKALGPITDD